MSTTTTTDTRAVRELKPASTSTLLMLRLRCLVRNFANSNRAIEAAAAEAQRFGYQLDHVGEVTLYLEWLRYRNRRLQSRKGQR